MPYSSGTFSLVSGNPVVTGTTVSSTWANNTLSDISANGLSVALLKDGTQTPTANIPMGSFRLTGLASAIALTDAITAAQVQNSSVIILSSVAGTNTITASASITPSAYASGQTFRFIPANTNTAATTLNVSSLGAKNIFWNGVACNGGEIKANIPIAVFYDGTQFNIISNGFAAPFLDTNPIAVGSSDGTKKVRVEVDGLTTATTRVVTVPDTNLTLAGTDVVNSWTSSQRFATATLTDGATIDWNLDTQQNAKVTLGGNRTLNNPSNLRDGQCGVLRIIQDGTGGRTLTWSSNYKFDQAITPTLSTAAADIDIFSYHCDGTNVYIAPFVQNPT